MLSGNWYPGSGWMQKWENNLPQSPGRGWGAQPSISSSSQPSGWSPTSCPCTGRQSSGALEKGILSDKPQPDPSVGFEVQQNPPCAPQEGPRCQVHIQGKLLLVCSSLALSKAHPWLPSLLFSPEIFLLTPLSPPQADHCVQASRQSFCGFGEGAAATSFVTPSLLKLGQPWGVNLVYTNLFIHL